MLKPRYIVHGGYVISSNDRDRHMVSALRVARLYGLNPGLPNVILINGDSRPERYAGIGLHPDDVHLYPRNDGNYTLPEKGLC